MTSDEASFFMEHLAICSEREKSDGRDEHSSGNRHYTIRSWHRLQPDDSSGGPVTPFALLAAAVLAAAPASSAQSGLATGQAAFAKGEFSKALKQLDAAAPQAVQARNLPLQVQIHLLRGQCYAALGDTAHAGESFLQALEVDPDAHLDAAKVSPAVISLLEARRSEARGEIRVTADEPADAFFDEERLGTTPFTGSVGIGHHWVWLRASDGRTTDKQEVVVFLKKAAEVALSFKSALLPPPLPPVLTPEPEPAPAPRFGGLDLYADLRVAVEPVTPNGGAATFGEIGVGFGHPNVSASLDVGVASTSFVFTVRATGRYPRIVSIVGAHASLDFQSLVLHSTYVPGLGVALGLDFDALKWLEPFLEGQFRHFFPVPGPQQYAGNIFLIGLGARWRLP
jgi:hypothetical protein